MENEVNKLAIILELLFFFYFLFYNSFFYFSIYFFIFLFFKEIQNYFNFLLLLHMSNNIKYSI